MPTFNIDIQSSPHHIHNMTQITEKNKNLEHYKMI